MKVVFCASDKPRERLLGDAFIQGVLEHGRDEGFVKQLTAEKEAVPDVDVAVMVGVKSRELWNAYWRNGAHVIMLDKGYVRHSGDGPFRLWEYWRTSVDAHHPTKYIMNVARKSDRFDKLGLKVRKWRKRGDHIVFAGSSAKYHDFYGLGDPTVYATKVMKLLRRREPGRDVIYRPKPSWKDAVPIESTTFSAGKEESIYSVLENAHALVTHGSNACFEAMLMGIPSIITGEGVAKPISSTTLEEISFPVIASDKDRLQLLHNLAYSQFTMHEFHEGTAWSILRPQILR